MIEMLLAILAVKYRHGIWPIEEETDDALEPYGGIDFAPPQRERPVLRLVK